MSGGLVIGNTPPHRQTFLIDTPLGSVGDHLAVWISTESSLDCLEDIAINFSKLIHDREAGLQGEQSSHVITVIESTEHHLAFDIAEFQEELVIGLEVHPRHAIGEPIEEVRDTGIAQLLAGVANPDRTRPADAIAARCHALRVVNDLHDAGRRLGRSHWSYDQAHERLAA
jgi:hypothetical protein